ncbi:hypothetical protein CTAYLR_008231 [Chrysophaeum taylorii]|uniref:Fe2OG dioxygenase domain-containing protein n=1 Tax=Chrysophaeum taylorii TaxID=2483200 RepID=A0AAD7UKD9_9STRA|nr:hypothetical protein CTAYLR_008231 [Chrysophaeum taylorii]
MRDALCIEVIARRVESEGYVVVDFAMGAAHAAVRLAPHPRKYGNRSSARNRVVSAAQATIATGSRQAVAAEKRDDRIAWLNKASTPAIAAHRLSMEALRGELERALDLRTDASTFMCAEYAEGSRGYVRHRDAAPTRPSGRKLTAIYYLNPSWSPAAAGQLLLWPKEGARVAPVSIAPLNDRLVVFKSFLEHQVLPSRAPRLAVTAWFYNRLELGLELIAEKSRLEDT